MRHVKRLLAALLAVLTLLCAVPALAETITVNALDYPVSEDGWYDTMEEVAVYLCEYGELPDNYMTKKEAQALGWSARRGNLWDVADGCSIGGDRFGNYEGLLPEAKGRRWTECDIDFDGGFRGGKRIVFSNDGLIYYTGDHYASFDEVEVVWTEDAGDRADAAYDGGTYDDEAFMRELDGLVDWLFGG